MKKFAFLIAALTLVSVPALSQDAPKQTPENAHRFLNILVTQNGMAVEKYTPNVHDGLHGPFNIARFHGKDARNPDHGTADWPSISGLYFMHPFQVVDYAGVACQSSLVLKGEYAAKMIATHTFGDLNPDYQINVRIPQDEKIYDVEFEPDLRKLDLIVDWSKAAGITFEEKEGKAIISVIGGGRFTVPTADLGKRVQYAMEFLRNACDPTADTGF